MKNTTLCTLTSIIIFSFPLMAKETPQILDEHTLLSQKRSDLGCTEIDQLLDWNKLLPAQTPQTSTGDFLAKEIPSKKGFYDFQILYPAYRLTKNIIILRFLEKPAFKVPKNKTAFRFPDKSLGSILFAPLEAPEKGRIVYQPSSECQTIDVKLKTIFNKKMEIRRRKGKEYARKAKEHARKLAEKSDFQEMKRFDYFESSSKIESICNEIGYKEKILNTYEGTGYCVGHIQGFYGRSDRDSLFKLAKEKCNKTHQKFLGREKFGECVLTTITQLLFLRPVQVKPGSIEMHAWAVEMQDECLKLGHHKDTELFHLCMRFGSLMAVFEGKEAMREKLSPEALKKDLIELKKNLSE
jgi:hypothetical protein